MANNKSDDLLSKVISLCKRRGFVFQSSEIYGGLASCWDYGPLGVDMKNNLADLWWHDMTILHDNIVGLDSSILMHPKVWEASGHVDEFTDPLVDCKECKRRFKADELVPETPPDDADWEMHEDYILWHHWVEVIGKTREALSSLEEIASSGLCLGEVIHAGDS